MFPTKKKLCNSAFRIGVHYKYRKKRPSGRRMNGNTNILIYFIISLSMSTVRLQHFTFQLNIWKYLCSRYSKFEFSNILPFSHVSVMYDNYTFCFRFPIHSLFETFFYLHLQSSSHA